MKFQPFHRFNTDDIFLHFCLIQSFSILNSQYTSIKIYLWERKTYQTHDYTHVNMRWAPSATKHWTECVHVCYVNTVEELCRCLCLPSQNRSHTERHFASRPPPLPKPTEEWFQRKLCFETELHSIFKGVVNHLPIIFSTLNRHIRLKIDELGYVPWGQTRGDMAKRCQSSNEPI